MIIKLGENKIYSFSYWYGVLFGLFICLLVSLCGCTKASTKIAIETSTEYIARNDDLINKYHDLVLQYMFTCFALKNNLTAEQLSEFNKLWNNRNVVEFWLIQHERNDTLHTVGIDAKLYDDQAIFSLMLEKLKKNVVNPIAENLGKEIGRWGVNTLENNDAN